MSDVFRETLLEFAERVEGLHGVSLIGRDGIAIDSVVPAEDSVLESVSAEITGVLSNLSAADLGIEDGTVRQFAVRSNKATIMLSAVTSEYYLLILLSPEGNAGRALFEARKAGFALEKELV
ncbi:MAG TPA: roadblock/LC7 domain-containing protein [Thermoanaerobaculia bacterium]|nr:roadblock/LC7 domain-containing protein [Thermoanaerobaculia bacterium]